MHFMEHYNSFSPKVELMVPQHQSRCDGHITKMFYEFRENSTTHGVREQGAKFYIYAICIDLAVSLPPAAAGALARNRRC